MSAHPHSSITPVVHADTHPFVDVAAWLLGIADVLYAVWIALSFWATVDQQARAGLCVLLLLGVALAVLSVRLRQATAHENVHASTLASYMTLTAFALLFCALLLLHDVLWIYAG